MAEAARQVVDWVQPDFIDLNFGCPVNKVVAKNGGSALLRDCPTLSAVSRCGRKSRGADSGDGKNPHRMGCRLRSTQSMLRRFWQNMESLR